MKETLVLVTGMFGASVLLASFVLKLTTRRATETQIFNLLNFGGGILLASYAFLIGSIPFLVIEIFWSILALYKFSKAVSVKNSSVKKRRSK